MAISRKVKGVHVNKSEILYVSIYYPKGNLVERPQVRSSSSTVYSNNNKNQKTLNSTSKKGNKLWYIYKTESHTTIKRKAELNLSTKMSLTERRQCEQAEE